MLTKFAASSVLDARIARQGAGLVKDAHRHEFQYEPRPGYLYVRSRMISSRTNDNFDHFPAEEIKKAWATFIGKPVFVNHHNDNHRRARGVIVDAALHEDTNPDGTEDTWVEGLMEVDAIRFPKLAQAIIAGEIDRTSMGTDVAFSVCSVCNNKAETPLDYCQHIPKLKGKKIRRRTAAGGQEDVLVYEKCYGLGFFENSLLVEEPADPTAYFLGVDARGLQSTASKTASSEMTDQEFVAALYEEANRLADENEESQVLFDAVEAFEPTKEWYARVFKDSWSTMLSAHLRDLAGQRSASKTADMAGIVADDLAYQQMLDHDLLHPAGVAQWGHPDFDLLSGNGHHPGPLVDLDRIRQRSRHLLDPYTSTPATGSKTALADFKVGDKIMWRHDAIGARSAIDGVVIATDGDSVTIRDDEHDFEAKVTKAELDAGRWTIYAQGSRTALNETIAPAKVDTLRDESCSVCGESDSYDGERCLVCGFMRPPDEFMEPDLEKARQVDLRQDAQEQADVQAEDGLADPNQAPGAPGEVGADPAKPWLSQTKPADGAAAGGKPWEQKTKPADGTETSEATEAPADGEADPAKPWESRTRRKKATRHTQKEKSMRPALAALAEQQKKVEALSRQNEALRGVVSFVVEAAGLSSHPRVASLMKAAADENPAQPVGWAIDSPEAQGSEAPAQTTEQALAPSQGKDDPEAIGETPNTDVSADATTSLDSTETVLDVTLDLNEQDPTKPVAGTDNLGEGERGNAGTNRTETEVRSGTGSNDTAFAETGWTTASAKPSEGRTIAALRLARLRVQAGIDQGDDLALGSAIAASDASDEAIQTEIETLAKVVTASAQQQRQPVARNLVPQPARQTTAQRVVPSFQQEASVPLPQVQAAHSPHDDEFMFE